MARVSRQSSARTEEEARLSKKWMTALYLRLSDEDERSNEENSIGSQKKICMDYLKTEENVQIENVYIDNGATGTNFLRDSFMRLMRDIQMGRINCVVVKDLSRFGRNYLETGEYLERIFPAMGVRFIAVNNGYDSEKGIEKKQSIVIPFSNMVNELYAKDTSRKIRSSIEVLMKSGTFLPASGSVPYGYLRDEINCTYRIDPETAEIVRLIFEKKLEGMSNCGIATYLNKKNIPSPGKIRYLRGVSKDKRNENALWTHKTIRQILSNETYIGHRIHGKVKRDRLGAVKEIKDADTWQYVYYAHEPVIEEKDFAGVQEILAADREKRDNCNYRKSINPAQREILKGKIFCGDCGALMGVMKRNQRLTSDKEPALFYQCNGYQYSGRMVCANHYLPQKVLLERLEKSLKTQIEIALDMDRYMKNSNFTAFEQAQINKILRKIGETEQEMKKIRSKMERILADYNEGMLDKQEYLYMKARYQDNLEETECRLTALKVRLDAYKEKERRIQGWIDTLKAYREGTSSDKIVFDRALFDELIEKIYVYEDRSMEVWFNFRNEFGELAEKIKEWGE